MTKETVKPASKFLIVAYLDFMLDVLFTYQP